MQVIQRPNRLRRTAVLIVSLSVLAACSTSPKPTAKPTFGPLPTVTTVAWHAANLPIQSSNAEHLTRIGSLLGHQATVSKLAFAHSHPLMLSQDGNGRVIAWDLNSGSRLYALTATSPLLAVAYAADDSLIIGVSLDGQLHTWRLADGLPNSTQPIGRGSALVTFSGSGQALAVGHDDGTIQVWRAFTPQAPATFSVQGTPNRVLRALTFSPDGSLLVSIGSDNLVHVWDAVNGASKAAFSAFQSPPLQGVISPDNKLLAIASGLDLHVLNLATLSEQFVVTQPDQAAQLGMAFSPDNHWIATASSGEFVYVWSTITTKLSARLPGHASVFSALSWSPDGSLLFTAAAAPDAGAYIWNVQTFAPDADKYPRGQVSGGTDVIYVGGWSPDNKRLITADERGSMTVWGIAP